jgi:hypothetical protein
MVMNTIDGILIQDNLNRIISNCNILRVIVNNLQTELDIVEHGLKNKMNNHDSSAGDSSIQIKKQ